MKNEEEVRVNWRAAVVPANGGNPVFGYANKLGKSRATVRMDRNLPLGCQCELVLMLPKASVDAPNIFVEGESVVSASVLSEMQFHITFDWVELKGSGGALLAARLGKQKQLWANVN
jgi:hypothetical protein